MSITSTGSVNFGQDSRNDLDPKEILVQLDRVLAHPCFRNSRRYPALLRFIVHQSLGGEADSLKERTLGVEVFGRPAGYDTNEDHIVRSTAAEIRKRLAIYYQVPAHEAQIRIELPSGSYVPQFRPAPMRTPAVVDHNGLSSLKPSVVPVFDFRPRRRWPAWAAAALLTAAASVFLVVRASSSQTGTAVGRFWLPVFKAPAPVALCMGDPRKAYAPPVGGFEPAPPSIRTLVARNVPFADAVTLARLSAFFSLQKRDYRVVYSPESSLWDLRQGSAVLVGGVDNYWAVRLTADLRFRFVAEGSSDTFLIEDRKTGKTWRTAEPTLNEQAGDWALVTRIHHPTTGQMVVVAGGIQEFGTLAAGEFLTSETALAELERLAPKQWKGENLQVVLATNVLKKAPSPPRIVTAEFW